METDVGLSACRHFNPSLTIIIICDAITLPYSKITFPYCQIRKGYFVNIFYYLFGLNIWWFHEFLVSLYRNNKGGKGHPM